VGSVARVGVGGRFRRGSVHLPVVRLVLEIRSPGGRTDRHAEGWEGFPPFFLCRRPAAATPDLGAVAGCLDGVARHDPIPLARARCQDSVIANRMGARRRDEGDQAFDELASLHQDVGGAVAPAGLEAQRECSIGALLEPLAR
jgi:hypothetical protein